MRYFIITHAKNPEGKHNEMINLDSKLRTRYSTDAAIILDYQEKKVIKNRFRNKDGSVKTFDELNTFYKQHYGHVIDKLEMKYAVLGDLNLEEILGGDETEVISADEIVEQAKDVT